MPLILFETCIVTVCVPPGLGEDVSHWPDGVKLFLVGGGNGEGGVRVATNRKSSIIYSQSSGAFRIHL